MGCASERKGGENSYFLWVLQKSSQLAAPVVLTERQVHSCHCASSGSCPRKEGIRFCSYLLFQPRVGTDTPSRSTCGYTDGVTLQDFGFLKHVPGRMHAELRWGQPNKKGKRTFLHMGLLI